ncbi:MAG: hypothetical protein IJS08_17010 [Victivallales bacterium]|nr:hypothetical protein [Victivallales bacterium]
MRLLVTDYHSLGDTVENTIALKHLHDSHPDIRIGVDMFAQELFDNMSWIDRSVTKGNCDKVVPISMDAIHQSNQNGLHVVRAIEMDLERALNLRIEPGELRAPICLTSEEINCERWLAEHGIPTDGYWIVDAGGKPDFTTKHYPHAWFQRIIDATPEITWVQIGMSEHCHKRLTGANVVDMLDRTARIRDLLKLFHRAAGVLTPISAPLHLATMPWHGHDRQYRPCVVLHGGREPVSFTQYPNQMHLHSLGMLNCCSKGGCWCNRVTDGEKQCRHPMCINGQWIGKCMSFIEPDMVAKICKMYNK